MIARVVLAALLAAATALLGGLASRFLGLHSFWPGVTAAFVVTFPLFLIIDWRTQ